MDETEKYALQTLIAYILVFVVAACISYTMTALLFYGICECFGLDVWSLKSSFIVWLVVDLAISTKKWIVERRHKHV